MDEQIRILTVTEITSEIRFHLSNEFSNVCVRGEISGLTAASSGHTYFTLKDQQAQINCVIWRSNAFRIPFELENGMNIDCFGNIDIYPPRGTYQLNVARVNPVGEGPLQIAFRQLYEKLKTEGLFEQEHKKPLPRIPRHIAVVTSPNGAAIRDFLQVLQRRWEGARVTILPAKVQGPGSALEIAWAIRSVNDFRNKPDVLVITRGGGSVEDLWSFNDERVCRAIFGCQVPVISAVGHETDVTLSDLTADVRALTPSEAAERIVPDKKAVKNYVDTLRDRLRSGLLAKYRLAKEQVAVLASKQVITRPLQSIATLGMDLDYLEQKLKRSVQQELLKGQMEVKEMAARLNSINPMSVLSRGYSLTSNSEGKLITDCNESKAGDTIRTRIANGTLVSQVSEVEIDESSKGFENET